MSDPSLEALKAIGKAMGQLALYKGDHPAAAQTLETAREALASAAKLSPDGALVFSLDQSRLLINGQVAAEAATAPKAILELFGRFKLSSLSFRSDLTRADLAALCELSLARPGSVPVDPRSFLSGKGVAGISLNEAVYLQAKPGAGAGVNGGDKHGVASEEPIREIRAAIQSGSIEGTIMSLVEKSVPDPAQRQKIFAEVLKLLERDIARHVEDLTRDLKREKKALENEGRRVAGVIDSLVEGVVVVDEEGKILMMNPAAEKIYGATLAQSAGRAITEKISDQFIVTLAAELGTPADRDIARDVRIEGAADTRRTVKASSAVVRTESGKVVGFMTGLTDAAKHRELQKVQSDFVAQVTHELRAPLSSIRAALEILRAEFGSRMEEEWGNMLDTALRNTDRLAQVINGILDFSKIESGQMTVHPRPCDPAAIAREAFESLQPWAKKKGLGFSLELPSGLPFVSADAPRAVQVLVNLLSNAIKYTPAGGRVALKISRCEEAGASFINFAVDDNGPGISPADQLRIFDKFVQLASADGPQGGTGLGLSIAKALVELQKGALRVDSQVGKGSVFSFSLPVSAAHEAEAPASGRAQAPSKKASWWRRLLRFK